MERKITNELLKWKSSKNKNALIVKGCRQVGKTYIIREFLRDNYDDYIEINFEEDPEKKKIFDGNLSVDAIMEKLDLSKSNFSGRGNKALFLDEIQHCSGAMSALKPLVQDGRFDIIASGSLLGITIDRDERLSPMGYVHHVEMRPMDFEEFLWAMGVSKKITNQLKDSIANKNPIDDFVLNQINSLFRRFVVVGGMPAAVLEYFETNDYNAARTKLLDIVNVIRSDALRYSNNVGRGRINACFESLPLQLSSEKKKFSYAAIGKKRYGAREYLPAIDWLIVSGVAMKCNNVTTPRLPFDVSADGGFKIYLSDTGILTAMMDSSVASMFVNKDVFCNNGALMENAVASSLRAKGYNLYYLSKADSTLEIDFLAVVNGQLSAIEVKSGKNKKSKSLTTITSDRYGVPVGIKISESNVFTDEKGILHLPLFAASFFAEEGEGIEIPSADIDSRLRK